MKKKLRGLSALNKVAVIKKNEAELSDLLKMLFGLTNRGDFGAIVTFTGVVRNTDWKGRKLKRLIYDADRE